MKLVKLEVKNFRSFQDPGDVAMADGMNVFVGPNNSGKSNLVRAIRMALDPDYRFSASADVPGQRLFAYPRTTLTFRCSGETSKEKTLLKYLDEYEKSVVPGIGATYASRNIVRLVVAYRGTQQTSFTRQEYFAARGAGDRRGPVELNSKALNQFRKVINFVAVESGQRPRHLLEGKFREVLASALQAELRTQFNESELARERYIETLQTALMRPMKDRLLEIARRLFPEVHDLQLVPEVPPLDVTLSKAAIMLTDSIETELERKGTGVAGGVLVALLRYLSDVSRESLVFAIEEPEAFLHPAAQEHLRDDLEALAERSRVSLVTTTHSPFIISRSPKAQVIAVGKSDDGVSMITDTANGSEPQSQAMSGLFRDTVVPELLDRSAAIPISAKALLLVEGSTDEEFINLAAERLKLTDQLIDLHVVANSGVNSLVAQAVLLRAETKKALWILLDSDENGRNARDHLVRRYGFDRKDVLEYRTFASPPVDGAEAEWLFPPKVMEEFIDQRGADLVLKAKIKVGGVFRYDFTPVGKEQFPQWLKRRRRSDDFLGWRPLLDELASRLTGLE